MATKKKETPKITDGCELKTLKKTQFIETGNIGIDIAFSDGKGIPMGTNIMFFGLPGTGKTTIFCDIIRRLITNHLIYKYDATIVTNVLSDSKNYGRIKRNNNR